MGRAITKIGRFRKFLITNTSMLESSVKNLRNRPNLVIAIPKENTQKYEKYAVLGGVHFKLM